MHGWKRFLSFWQGRTLSFRECITLVKFQGSRTHSHGGTLPQGKLHIWSEICWTLLQPRSFWAKTNVATRCFRTIKKKYIYNLWMCHHIITHNDNVGLRNGTLPVSWASQSICAMREKSWHPQIGRDFFSLQIPMPTPEKNICIYHVHQWLHFIMKERLAL